MKKLTDAPLQEFIRKTVIVQTRRRKMDLIQFTIGLLMILVGIAIIVSPELATIIAVVVVILGIVTIYDGMKKR